MRGTSPINFRQLRDVMLVSRLNGPVRLSKRLIVPSFVVPNRPRGFAGPGCAATAARSFSISSAKSTAAPKNDEKPYYVTTPIFYVNAAPHVGHMFAMVLADVLKRWQQLKGNKAIMCTGTDEHGMKVQRAANQAGMEPKAFCDKGAEMFSSLAEYAHISNDHFIRTTDQEHKDAVQYAWTLLQERNYIYLSEHEGWYAVSDETFYPESGVHLIVEPATGRKIMASIETGKEVEWTSETNYRFRLSAFQDRLLDFYKKNPKFIVPPTRMNDIVQSVSSGLDDLSVSRPSNRLTWGVPVPMDSSQTIYVWLDALLNYTTKAGYPWGPGAESSGGWPADCQIIGKDIMRFHCIYWPAFLMALDLPLPKQILTHAHWTLGREKMAKSTGNVVNPFFALNRFGQDLMRYYMANDGGISQDADYSNEFIIERYKKDLNGGLGNLVSRITRGKKWSVRRAVKRAADGELEPLDSMLRIQRSILEDAPLHFERRMDELDISGAIKVAMNVVYKTNTFLQQVQPWALASRSSSEAHEIELDRIIFLSAEAIRIVGILLQPVMPSKMSRLLDMLGVSPSNRGFDSVMVGTDDSYGTSKVDLGRGHIGVLFPPLESDH